MSNSKFTFTAGITVRAQVAPTLEEYFEENDVHDFSLQVKKGRFESFYTLTINEVSDNTHNDIFNFLHSLNVRNIEVN